MALEVSGQIIAGKTGQILVRGRVGGEIQIGDLLVAEEQDAYMILQAYELLYGSQVPQLVREMLAGMKLEGMGAGMDFLELNCGTMLSRLSKGFCGLVRTF